MSLTMHLMHKHAHYGRSAAQNATDPYHTRPRATHPNTDPRPLRVHVPPHVESAAGATTADSLTIYGCSGVSANMKRLIVSYISCGMMVT